MSRPPRMRTRRSGPWGGLVGRLRDGANPRGDYSEAPPLPSGRPGRTVLPPGGSAGRYGPRSWHHRLSVRGRHRAHRAPPTPFTEVTDSRSRQRGAPGPGPAHHPGPSRPATPARPSRPGSPSHRSWHHRLSVRPHHRAHRAPPTRLTEVIASPSRQRGAPGPSRSVPARHPGSPVPAHRPGPSQPTTPARPSPPPRHPRPTTPARPAS